MKRDQMERGLDHDGGKLLLRQKKALADQYAHLDLQAGLADFIGRHHPFDRGQCEDQQQHGNVHPGAFDPSAEAVG